MMPANQHARRTAFSLVELSIVLVILGLLVGGILSGRSLIRSAQLRAITTERDKYTAAIFAFRDKYFQLPGDLSTAYQFWSTACGTNTTAPSTGCNGNGDGLINLGTTGETVKAWEHLARAGMIEGSYDGTGTDDGTGAIYMSKTNSPASKFPNAYWYIGADAGDVDASTPAGPALYMKFGGISVANPDGRPLRGSIADGFTLSRSEAWILDQKVDDGKSATGKMHGDSADDCNDSGGGSYGANLSAGGKPDENDCSITFYLQ